jgi:hypothetical protein
MFRLWLRLMRSEEQRGQGAWEEVIFLGQGYRFGFQQGKDGFLVIWGSGLEI